MKEKIANIMSIPASEVFATYRSTFITLGIIYLVIGLIIMLGHIIYDMRGEEYDSNYFDIGQIFDLLGDFFWLPTLIWVVAELVFSWFGEKKFITRFFYTIANIGIVKKTDTSQNELSNTCSGYGEHKGNIPIVAGTTAKVYSIEVKLGQEVKQDDTVMIVETMKMEIPITAPQNGIVASIEVMLGDSVDSSTVVATLI